MAIALCAVSEAQTGGSPIIGNVRITGNKALSTEEILNASALGARQTFDESRIQSGIKRILGRYAEEGYLHARIDSVSIDSSVRNEAILLMAVDEGKLSIVRSVTFEGNRAVSTAELTSQMRIQARSPFNQPALESDLERLLKYYENRGYPFAKLAVKDLSFLEQEEQYDVSISISFDEGSLVRISELRIEGNKTTRDFVVTREARVKENDLYQGDLPDKVRRRLERLQLFSSVSPPELYITEENKAGLLLRITEGSPNRFDGVVGYMPATGSGEEGYFTGLVDVQFRNILGTGRKFAVRWYRENQASQEIELHYLEPWIASYPINASVAFFQRKQDSVYVRRQYDLNVELMVSEDLSLGGSFSQSSVIPGAGSGTPVVGESRIVSVGGFIRYDSRDNPVVPTEGVLYRSEYSAGTKDIHQGSAVAAGNNSTQRVGLDLQYYTSPVSRQVIATGLHVLDFRTPRIEASDLFRLGGASSLRGYREGQFLGSTLVWMNAEYRFLVSPRSFMYGFGDVGYIVVPDNPAAGLQRSEQTKIGYGVGLQVDSRLGFIGVSLGFGQGDTFSTAKIHIRLVGEF